VALADFKSVMPREERGRWVRLPRTPASKTLGFCCARRPTPTKADVIMVVTTSQQVVTIYIADCLALLNFSGSHHKETDKWRPRSYSTNYRLARG